MYTSLERLAEVFVALTQAVLVGEVVFELTRPW